MNARQFAKRTMGVSAAILAATLALSNAEWAAGAEWTASQQPDLAQSAAQARALKVEDLVEPVKSARLDTTYFVPNPDGVSYDILQIYFKQYDGPNTIIIMNTGKGTMKQVETGRGYGFHIAPKIVAPNGKLYMSILGAKSRVQVCSYDPASGELKLDALKMPDDMLGETHPICLGTDGKVYCSGGHPSQSATAAQIDPETGTVTSYGAIGPTHKPADCWAYSMAADGRYIYIASGEVPWYLVAYDRQAGKSETLVTTERVGGRVTVGQGPFGCTASATKVVGTDGKRIEYWLYEGKAIPKKDKKEAPPWPEKSAQPKATPPPRPEISTAAATPDVNGDCTFWYRLPKDKPAASGAPAKKPAQKAAEKGEDAGEAVPEAIPDSADMEAQGWKSFHYKVPIYPMSTHRLVELPDGRLFGTAGAYEGNFLYDPKTNTSVHPGKIHLSHYATVISDGKVYMSGYPSSPVYVYDPAKPWTAGERVSGTKVMADNDPQANPRCAAHLREAGTHKMYSAAAANGKIYFGGRWYRNGNHGGIGWWDPKTQKAGGFWEPFSNYQVNFIAAADEGKLIVISAHRVEDNVLGKPKPEQGALFFLDTTTDKLIGDKERGGIPLPLEPVLKAKGPGPILCVGDARIVGWTENPEDPKTSILYGVDAADRKVVFRKTIPFALPVKIGSNQMEAWDFRLGPDVMIWTFLDKDTLARIDPKDATVQVVGKVKGGRLAFSGKDLYLAGSETIRCVRNVVQ